ncbi:hypothetical protein EHQ76_15210 [Leptospira barantonii]|uniref:YcxB-like protein domain-containing protein n=1 Tax=Leptospira barantonii TaxID=2023184 RepID=A0A5F2B020_9LEPT|nr:hypothetical protein [Leptospira barantonii]TGL97480.1 hypothetical protein EHQ76_15210 [Leptospira barantonii]
MEFLYSLSADKQKKNYLFGYYNRPFLWFQRKLLGPLLLVFAGIEFWVGTDAYMKTVFTLFFGFIGIYYILRPYIFLKRIQFKAMNGKIRISNDTIQIFDEKGELRLQREDVLDLIFKKNYIFLKSRVNSVVFFLIDLDGVQGDSVLFVDTLHRFMESKTSS